VVVDVVGDAHAGGTVFEDLKAVDAGLLAKGGEGANGLPVRLDGIRCRRTRTGVRV
jgi:hypothetical protein